MSSSTEGEDENFEIVNIKENTRFIWPHPKITRSSCRRKIQNEIKNRRTIFPTILENMLKIKNLQ